MSNPPWARTASIYDYGAHPQKTNYMGQGLIDARTDVGAQHINRAGVDLQAAVRMAPFLIARLTLNDTSPDDPTVHWCLFMPTGEVNSDFAGDAPPAGFPTFTRLGNGNIRITFDASYQDELGVSVATDVRDATGCGAGSAFANVTGQRASATTAEFFVSDSGGTALNDQTITVRVY